LALGPGVCCADAVRAKAEADFPDGMTEGKAKEKADSLRE
jgi:hypothetical protein